MAEKSIQILSVISFSATGGAMARYVKEKLPEMSIRLYGKYSTDAAADAAKPLLENEAAASPDILKKGNADSAADDRSRIEENAEEIPVTCSIAVWAGERMREKDALLFIGAAGIAVRSIAPHIKNKLVDSPVLVMDELGKHIIPLLSGHVGGANALAEEIAKAVGAEPVITTATDLHERFAVDVFAKNNYLRIGNKNGIAPISSKVLRGGELIMAVEGGCISEEALKELPAGIKVIHIPNEKDRRTAENAQCALQEDNIRKNGTESNCTAEEMPSVDILISGWDIPGKRTIWLPPKPYVIGIGCRKEKDAETIEAFVNEILAEHHITHAEIRAAASIDIKKDEPGILAFCRKYRIPFRTFSAEELLKAPGEYEESAFVKQTVGVGNVCERSAMCAAERIAGECGAEGEPVLICRKRKGDGVTCSISMWRKPEK